MNIYVSTGGYYQPADETARLLADAGINGIELSGGQHAVGLVDRLAALRDRVVFQVHNYFPPPAVPFVLNMGSLDEETGQRSLAHVERALECCVAVGADRYSFHAGFLLDPHVNELGQRIQSRQLFDRDECIAAFVGRVCSIATSAAGMGVSVMVENNVLSARNAAEFQGNPLLMCDPDECHQIMKQMPNNVGLLIDVAHLKVSAQTLGFDPAVMFEKCNEWIVGYHLSDNDGLEDSNRPFAHDAWFWRHLKRDAGYYSVEVYGLAPQDMPQLVDIIEEKLISAAG